MHERDAVAYTRVSTERQTEGWSLDVQGAKALDYAQRYGLRIVAKYQDETSASKGVRQGFVDLCEYVRSHLNVRDIVVEKIDRASRNTRDQSTLEDLVMKHSVTIHGVRDGTILNRSSAPGEWLKHDVEMAVAKHHGRNLALEVRKGMCTRAEAGYFVNGRPPPGYSYPSRVRSKAERRQMIAPDGHADIVRDLFSLYADREVSLHTLAERAAEAGLRKGDGETLAKTTIAEMLRNRTYIGEIFYDRRWYPGHHERLISAELFERVQAKLRARGGYAIKGDKHRRPYSGVFCCALCGGPIVAQARSRLTKQYHWWCCRSPACPARAWVDESVTDAAVADALRCLAVPQDLVDAAVARLQRGGVDAPRKSRRDLERKRDGVTAKIDMAADAMLDGSLDRDLFARKHGQLRDERDRIQAEIDALAMDSVTLDRARRLASATLDLTREMPALYAAATQDERRRILDLLVVRSGRARSTWRAELVARAAGRGRPNNYKGTVVLAWRPCWVPFARLSSVGPVSRGARLQTLDDVLDEIVLVCASESFGAALGSLSDLMPRAA